MLNLGVMCIHLIDTEARRCLREHLIQGSCFKYGKQKSEEGKGSFRSLSKDLPTNVQAKALPITSFYLQHWKFTLPTDTG